MTPPRFNKQRLRSSQQRMITSNAKHQSPIIPMLNLFLFRSQCSPNRYELIHLIYDLQSMCSLTSTLTSDICLDLLDSSMQLLTSLHLNASTIITEDECENKNSSRRINWLKNILLVEASSATSGGALFRRECSQWLHRILTMSLLVGSTDFGRDLCSELIALVQLAVKFVPPHHAQKQTENFQGQFILTCKEYFALVANLVSQLEPIQHGVFYYLMKFEYSFSYTKLLI
jgi:hypothetical protein